MAGLDPVNKFTAQGSSVHAIAMILVCSLQALLDWYFCRGLLENVPNTLHHQQYLFTELGKQCESI
jgi:hypothetical protein